MRLVFRVFVVIFIVTLLSSLTIKLLDKRRGVQHYTIAHISEGLNSAIINKYKVEHYHLNHGRFPSSNNEMHLPAPEKFKDRSLNSLTISKDGVITVLLTKKSGVENGAFQLRPSYNKNKGFKWKCSTPNYTKISIHLPPCEYLKEKEK